METPLSFQYLVELDPVNTVLRGIVCDDIQWATENLGGRWVPTWTDVPGKVYAGKGFEYMPLHDNFRPARPFPSWTFDDDAWVWTPPTPRPDDDAQRAWDESSLTWAEMGTPDCNFWRPELLAGFPVDPEPDMCTCEPGGSCDFPCINRSSGTVCVNCPAGSSCTNSFVNNTRLYVRDFPGTGKGLVCADDIQAGQFVVEYLGKIITDEERAASKSAYLMHNSGELWIDAEAHDHPTSARYINHSCDPNCVAEHMVRLGRPVVGIYAKDDIPHGHQLTFKYSDRWAEEFPGACRCVACLAAAVDDEETQTDDATDPGPIGPSQAFFGPVPARRPRLDTVRVGCGAMRGILDLLNTKVLVDNQAGFISPGEFEILGGRLRAKNWKTSLRVVDDTGALTETIQKYLKRREPREPNVASEGVAKAVGKRSRERAEQAEKAAQAEQAEQAEAAARYLLNMHESAMAAAEWAAIPAVPAIPADPDDPDTDDTGDQGDRDVAYLGGVVRKQLTMDSVRKLVRAGLVDGGMKFDESAFIYFFRTTYERATDYTKRKNLKKLTKALVFKLTV